MRMIKWILLLLTFAATIAQGLWLEPLQDEAILVVDIPLVLLYIFGLGQKKMRQSPSATAPIVLGVIFTLWSFGGVFFAPNRVYLYQEILMNLRAILIFFAIILFVNRKEDLQFLFLGFAFGALYEGFVAIHQWLRGSVGLGFLGEQHWGWQAMGTFVHASVCGYYLSFVSILTFRMAVYLRPKFHPFYVAAFFFGVVGLYATFNRANWLGFAGAMSLIFGFDFIRGTALTRRSRGLLAVMLIVGVIGFLRYGWTMIERFSDAEYSLAADRSSSRLNLAKDAIRIMNEHPYTGTGLNNYREYVNPGTAGLQIVHSTYLLVGAELGYPGLMLFVAVIGSFLVLGLKLRRSRDPFIRQVATAAVTAIIAFAIAMSPSPDFRNLYVKNHIWMAFGITVVAAKLEYHQNKLLANPRVRDLLKKKLLRRQKDRTKMAQGAYGFSR